MDRKSQAKEIELQNKESQLQANENKIQELKTTLIQTKLDLANAILLIQEKETELVKAKAAKPKVIANPMTFALTDSDADNIPTSTASSHAGFGTKFPSNPQKGDMFLRVDMLPNKLYKWNGQKWIEVVKSTTDRYAYEEEYIKYITTKIIQGEYDMDDLSKPEQDAVLKLLSYEQKGRL